MEKRVFNGEIGRTIPETNYRFKVVGDSPKKKPNVIYILLDDMGFAHLGCYGSNINTPNIDRLAREGLRYNNFHTTAVCSATRCSLLTGANHHTAGIASLVEFRTGLNNGIGKLNPEYATIAEILHEYGYATFCNGKWHLDANQSSANQDKSGWPLGKGFDKYYGFLYGENDQYHPHLMRDNSRAEQPKTVEEGYHFSEDVVDNAIDNIYEHVISAPEQPFFLYLAFGAMHTPHHAPKSYIEKYRGKFDEGWDVIRQRWFENQKKLGVIPQDAELTEKNPYIKDWDTLNDKQKAVYAREMEAFAGMLDHVDTQIGRLIDYLEKAEILDDTVIVFLSDNGASAEGGVDGRFNGMRGQDVTVSAEGEVDYAYEHLDEIGTELSFNHYATGWANAGNTPFQWYKIWAHEGGIKDPLIIRYPGAITKPGLVLPQYHHVSDITPTILDILGVDKPAVIKGVPQKPCTGTSLAYTFENPEAEDQKTIQYYEVMGNRGIYHKGWKAVVNHTFNESYAEDEWELYHVAEDYSEKYNVADKYPEKLQELKEDFMHEAGKYGVFPMIRAAFHAKPENIGRLYGDNLKLPGKKIVFKNVIKPVELQHSNNVTAASVSNSITAVINRTDKNQQGVIYANGQRFGGVTFYVKDNHLKYGYNANILDKTVIVTSDIELPLGEVTVGYIFVRDSKDTGNVKIYINGKQAGEAKIPHIAYMVGFTTTLKANWYTSVVNDYEAPFEFSGEIKKIELVQFDASENIKEQVEKILSVE